MGLAAAAGFGLSAIQGIAKHKQASADAEIANATKAMNNQQVQETLLSTYQSLEVQADQVGEEFIARSIDQQKMEARTRGKAIAAQGASRTGGTGLDMQMQDADVESNMNTARAQINKERQLDSIASQGKAAVVQANQRFDRMPDQTGPSAFSSLLEVGVSGFRNTLNFQEFGKSWDANFGDDNPSTFNTDDLIDSPIYDDGRRTA
jgi:hypothetical protein